MYYCLCAPKIGAVPQQANQHPGRGYAINADWITPLWQHGKLTDANAVREYVRCKKDVHRLCRNVRDQQELRREHELEEMAAAMAWRLAGMQRDLVRVPAVDALPG